uniref:Uncharacterized protein n=1 Tax=Glossina pallidipes TaxID=7398 RepID=A0A1A9Z6K5_GLOPL
MFLYSYICIYNTQAVLCPSSSYLSFLLSYLLSPTLSFSSLFLYIIENMHLSFFILLRPVQWNSPKNTAKPGANWTPQPMAATTGAGYRPMAHGMTVSPAPITINHPYVHASYPVIPNYMQQGMPVMGQPMMGQAPLTGVVPPTMTTPLMVPSNSNVSSSGVITSTQTIQNMMQANGGNKTVPLDPFGAL